MEQKQVYLTGLKVENYKTIKAVTLTPDILNNRLIRVTGEIGNGKSTLLEGLNIALSGGKAAAKKDSLSKGFVAEAQISDGEQDLFIGAKVREISRGANEGNAEFDTFIYQKDINGKIVPPIVDGAGVTAKDYMNMLHTDITFSLDSLFDKNQTTHRKVIEKTFAPELAKLKIDEVVEKIAEAKVKRDNARALCDANGAFMSTFEAEGYNEDALRDIKKVDEEAILKKLTSLEIDKDRIVNASDERTQLAEEKARTERTTKLSKIEIDIRSTTEKIRAENEKNDSEYKNLYSEYSTKTESLNSITGSYNSAISTIKQCSFLNNPEALGFCEEISIKLESYKKLNGLNEIKQPKKEVTIVITDGIPIIDTTVEYGTTYSVLIKQRSALTETYKQLKDSPMKLEVTGAEDNTKKIERLEILLESTRVQLQGSKDINSLVSRFGYWIDWIEKKGIYEREIDTLRKLYAKVNTGVDGLSIVPETTKTDRVEIWLKYTGVYDTDFFHNKNLEPRYLFDYSKSQEGIIGLLIQSARLDMKPKAMRLALLDDVPMTKKGIDLLNTICEKKDLHLWTTQTSDQYDTNSPDDGQVIIEGGEIFFK